MRDIERLAIVRLAAKAGISPLRLGEIESGCCLRRACDILWAQIDCLSLGTLVLSDPQACWDAVEFAESLR